MAISVIDMKDKGRRCYMEMKLKKILGLKVVCIRGFESSGKPKKNKLYQTKHILFNDRKTFIELDEQDYYSFYDCSASARHIIVHQDEKRWKDIYDDLGCYPEANDDI